MKILVADDDMLISKSLYDMLVRWGYEVTVRNDGRAALEFLQAKNAPVIALIDRMMPEMDGLEVCRKIRANEATRGIYIILLTGLGSTSDIVKGLEAGANDYVTKPFVPDELRVRIAVGVRVANLQGELANHVRELEQALKDIKQLQGLLPICSCCKKIRDEKNYWHMVEDYISKHSDARFTHGYCPECYERIMKEIDKYE